MYFDWSKLQAKVNYTYICKCVFCILLVCALLTACSIIGPDTLKHFWISESCVWILIKQLNAPDYVLFLKKIKRINDNFENITLEEVKKVFWIHTFTFKSTHES